MGVHFHTKEVKRHVLLKGKHVRHVECGGSNHFTKCCRNKPHAQNQQNTGRPDRLQHRVHTLNKEHNENKGQLDDEYLFVMNTENVTSQQQMLHLNAVTRPHETISILNCHVYMHIDSEAAVNIINKAMYNAMQPKLVL